MKTLTEREERLRGRFKKLEEYFSILRIVREKYGEAEFLSDAFIYSTGERNLHLAIESLFDLGNMALSEVDAEVPYTYADILSLLKDKKIIDKELHARIEKLPGFRNILVHEYANLDRKIVYRKIKEDLVDLEDFAKVLYAYLKL
ncbi:MAG: DUF86 domain-containing protein [Actinobacteria bacterium]|nr:DUF86 domain-containing protein [Actinomycetota bacterium]